MGHMTSGLGGLAPFFRRFLPLLNGYTPFFQPFFGHFWPPVNGFLPSPSGWDCSDFTSNVTLAIGKGVTLSIDTADAGSLAEFVLKLVKEGGICSD
mgnify:CR=1 FL=1